MNTYMNKNMTTYLIDMHVKTFCITDVTTGDSIAGAINNNDNENDMQTFHV